jgi:hypothetical protein
MTKSDSKLWYFVSRLGEKVYKRGEMLHGINDIAVFGIGDMRLRANEFSELSRPECSLNIVVS